MTDAERAYWTVLVQVLPVLGLALVLEARTLAEAFRQHAQALPGGGVFVRRWQLSVLTFSGLAIAFGLMRGLAALGDDEPPGAVEATLIEVAVPLAVGGLLINPLLSVVVASEAAWVLQRILRWSPKRRLQAWRILRELSRLEGRIARLRSQAFDDLQRTKELTADTQGLLDLAVAAGSQDPVLGPARAHVEKGLAIVDDLRRRHRSLLVRELNFRRYRREVRALLDEIWLDLPDVVQVTGDPLLGLVSAEVRSSRDAPDDGGFMSDPPAGARLPTLPDTERLIIDREDFFADA